MVKRQRTAIFEANRALYQAGQTLAVLLDEAILDTKEERLVESTQTKIALSLRSLCATFPELFPSVPSVASCSKISSCSTHDQNPTPEGSISDASS